MSLRLLAVSAVLLSVLPGQDAARSSTPEIVLPVSNQARPLDGQGHIVVEVSSKADAWAVGLGGKIYDVVGDDVDAAFATALGRVIASKARTTSLLVRSDAKAPYRVPYLVMKAAVEAGLTRMLFATRKDATATAHEAILWQLPDGDGPPDPDGLPDVRLAARLRRGQVVRTFDIDPKPVAPDLAGDQKLEALLRAKRDEQKTLWKVEIPVVIEAEAAVPWQHVIDLLSVARRAGSPRIELDLIAPEEKNPPPAAAPPPERPMPAVPDVEPSPGEVTSRPTPEITPPRSTQAVPFDVKNPIEVWIFRDAAHTATRPFEGWRWQVRQRIYTFDQAGFRGLTVNLAQRAGVIGNGLSSRTLLIRADARAPHGLLQKAFEAAALAHIYKIHVAAIRDEAGPIRALACWLPRESEAPPPDLFAHEIRVIMSWNKETAKVERLLGQTVLPLTPEGNARLESLVRDSFVDMKKQGHVPEFLIDAGPRVPCQAVIEALDLAAKIGIERVGFGFGDESLLK